ncbi:MULTISPECIES: PPK2 family polyphosphate kinase [Brevibacterium]|uniref:Polyphosphate--nucleotide phosphotransferase n=1 Tax=Brevibacterium aurantiacum TaxID=273384 RepID=A0A2A3ZRG1_BREAU|nr:MULTISPECIES: polyphosphate--nucleotide phosphotransferase [Brevibacterium]MDN5551402.1 polyphosphate--nucleotide phosphotransferase [Brevibacterium sp.]AZL07293.1 polyphosphate--nucleotide phosphotransferase [Brevibacterium aurantiacum]AZL14511.1 polyphosphate--nucleotide phosphotransferase [Brevibacterium aurantiacum]AZT95096.1 polyphosphate--nucleotide phosphotransferase [Brevibacterium aurantiacum]MDN6374346.1 polyphosphate--nucleotide phosphotransferase [Brevibacterium aurantiacum]
MSEKTTQSWSSDPQPLLRAGKGFRLDEVDPHSTPGYEGNKKSGRKDLKACIPELDDLQERLFAAHHDEESGPAVLLILQAMDTAGKGGIVRHVVGSVDPQGVELAAFKAPTKEELSHDFLWRIRPRVPGPGMIGVFDRSHYEDVLIGKVRELADDEEIERRYTAINDFEAGLAEAGVRIIKVMLNISPDEQKDRLMERLDRPDKYWKYNPGDVDERLMWPDYMRAYQTVFERTSTEVAPWYVVPADRKWYARIAVQRLLLNVLRDIDPQWPAADFDIDVERERLAES